ncbi:hypothetical protein C477_00755 [Haloterrigena salina JCM 13891]|uniref:Uncharacterized protein n=1 Tax=Haloterrigena salina JCM 13891 TaxID=1227488 RepID=M0CMH2_9EURY|nr:hypothetical protein C477_00755 [Haloterrigena salina JCM 13891]
MDIGRPPFSDDFTFVSNVFEEQLVERLEEFERYRFALFDRVKSFLKGAFGIQDLLQVSTHVDVLVSAGPRVMGVYFVHVDISAFYFGGFDGLESNEGRIEDR